MTYDELQSALTDNYAAIVHLLRRIAVGEDCQAVLEEKLQELCHLMEK